MSRRARTRQHRRERRKARGKLRRGIVPHGKQNMGTRVGHGPSGTDRVTTRKKWKKKPPPELPANLVRYGFSVALVAHELIEELRRLAK